MSETQFEEYLAAADSVAVALNDPRVSNATAARLLEVYYKARDAMIRDHALVPKLIEALERLLSNAVSPIEARKQAHAVLREARSEELHGG